MEEVPESDHYRIIEAAGTRMTAGYIKWPERWQLHTQPVDREWQQKNRSSGKTDRAEKQIERKNRSGRKKIRQTKNACRCATRQEDSEK